MTVAKKSVVCTLVYTAKNQLGAAMIEYGLLLGGIALVAMLGVASLGDVVQDPFVAVVNPSVNPPAGSPSSSGAGLPNTLGTSPPSGGDSGGAGGNGDNSPSATPSVAGDSPVDTSGPSSASPSSTGPAPSHSGSGIADTASTNTAASSGRAPQGSQAYSDSADSTAGGGGERGLRSAASDGMGQGGAGHTGAGSGRRDGDGANVSSPEQHSTDGIAMTQKEPQADLINQSKSASMRAFEASQDDRVDGSTPEVDTDTDTQVSTTGEGLSWWSIAFILLEVAVLGYLLWRLHCFIRRRVQRMQKVQDRRWSGI